MALEEEGITSTVSIRTVMKGLEVTVVHAGPLLAPVQGFDQSWDLLCCFDKQKTQFSSYFLKFLAK